MRNPPVILKISFFLVLLLSLIANIILCVRLWGAYEDEEIVGSYCTGDPTMPLQHMYAVLESGGDYVIYQQFNLMEKGTYCTQADGQMILTSDYGKTVMVSDEKGRLCWIKYNPLTEEETITTFTKYSDTPNYINLTSDAQSDAR